MPGYNRWTHHKEFAKRPDAEPPKRALTASSQYRIRTCPWDRDRMTSLSPGTCINTHDSGLIDYIMLFTLTIPMDPNSHRARYIGGVAGYSL